MDRRAIVRSKRNGPHGAGIRVLRSPPATSLRRMGHLVKPSARVYNRKTEGAGVGSPGCLLNSGIPKGIEVRCLHLPPQLRSLLSVAGHLFGTEATAVRFSQGARVGKAGGSGKRSVKPRLSWEKFDSSPTHHAGFFQRSGNPPDKRRTIGSTPTAGTSFYGGIAQRESSRLLTGRLGFEPLCPYQHAHVALWECHPLSTGCRRVRSPSCAP